MNIGYYKKITNLERDSTIDLQLFLDSIRNGKWEDLAYKIRGIRDKQERKLAKESLPSVTLSGVFRSRLDNSLEEHSGLIGIDLDELPDVDETKRVLQNDPYVRAIFTTISGNGLCVIIPIDSHRHREQFGDICRYMYEKYQLVCDTTSVNESRIRYVSYDPELIDLPEARVFDVKYAKEPKPKIPDVVFSQKDFDRLMIEIETNSINITETYYEWVRVGFSLVHQFKEAGREYFHSLSKHSTKYRRYLCDRQYDACLKAQGMNVTTIATFYYYCKNAGLKIYSKETERINHSFRHGKEAGLSAQQIKDNLERFEGIRITDEEAQGFFNSNVNLGGGKSKIIDELELFVRQNYVSLRRNEVTRYLELNDMSMKTEDYNSIYISAKKIMPDLHFDLMDRLLNSSFIPRYNPIKDFFNSLKETDSQENIIKLFSSIHTDSPDYALYFGKKWLVSIIASAFGEHSPLMLVLCGRRQNTGKTEFFRRLFPAELRRFYAESKLDAGKDDEILMCQKLLIMDDEMGGKNKKEDKRLKELISKQHFSLREPYGRYNVELLRMAVLCGTTNDEEILYDATGNRRILPIYVNDINHGLYNSIDKKELFREAYNLYLSGYDWHLNSDDIAMLAANTNRFDVTTLEGELIDLYFAPSDTTWLTSADIKIIIENKSNQRISLQKLCQQLKRLGFEQRVQMVDFRRRRCYGLVERTLNTPKDNLF